MAGTQHESLTTDDLLRLQEQKPRKRRRTATPSDSSGSLSGSDSEDESEHTPSSEVDRPFIQDALEEEKESSRFILKPRNAVDTPSKLPPTSPTHTFSSLGITPTLVAAMSKMSIQAPTEVQAACIPPLFAGKRLVKNCSSSPR